MVCSSSLMTLFFLPRFFSTAPGAEEVVVRNSSAELVGRDDMVLGETWICSGVGFWLCGCSLHGGPPESKG